MKFLTKATKFPEKLSKRESFAVQYVQQPIMARVCEKMGITQRTGYKWLHMPSTAKKISQLRAITAQKCDFTLQETLNAACRIVDFDIKTVIKHAEYDTETGYWTVQYEDWDKIDGRVIKDVKPIIRDGIQVFQIKLYDKTPYVKMLLEHFKDVKPDQHLHVHMNQENLKDINAQQAAEQYHQMLGR